MQAFILAVLTLVIYNLPRIIEAFNKASEQQKQKEWENTRDELLKKAQDKQVIYDHKWDEDD